VLDSLSQPVGLQLGLDLRDIVPKHDDVVRFAVDVADMIARSAGVREKIRRSIAHGGLTGTTRLEQSDYGDSDLQFAYGAIDCVQWIARPPAGRRCPSGR